MRASVEALRRAASKDPSWERTWREIWIVLWGYRLVKREEAKVDWIVDIISLTLLYSNQYTIRTIPLSCGPWYWKGGENSLVCATNSFSVYPTESCNSDLNPYVCTVAIPCTTSFTRASHCTEDFRIAHLEIGGAIC